MYPNIHLKHKGKIAALCGYAKSSDIAVILHRRVDPSIHAISQQIFPCSIRDPRMQQNCYLQRLSTDSDDVCVYGIANRAIIWMKYRCVLIEIVNTSCCVHRPVPWTKVHE